MTTVEIRVFRGDDRTIKLVVRDNAGALVDLSGGRCKFTAATKPSQIQKDTNNGVGEAQIDSDQVTNRGVVRFFLVPADTKGATPKTVGTVAFDCEIVLAGKTQTVVNGFFKLAADVT